MRTTAKLTAVAVLASLLAVAQIAVAQEEETSGTGAYVTGTLLDLTHDTSTETSDWKGDVLEWRDWVTIFQYEWSDPRMPSEIRTYNNGNEYILQGRTASERGGHIRGTAVGHGRDGSWQGPFTGLYPDTIDDVHNWMVLTGSGGYEGLYAVVTNHDWYDADAMEHRHEVEALIAEGEPPPVPEIPAE